MVVDVLWLILIIGVLVGLWYLAYRIEPHWSTRDGQRFVCNTQELFAGAAHGRLREAQVTVQPDGALRVSHKRALRRATTTWRLAGRAEGSSTARRPTKVVLYVARPVAGGDAGPSELALRIPRSSRVVPVLDALLPGDRGAGPST